MYKIFIICCSIFITSFVKALVPLPDDVKRYESRLSEISKKIEEARCHDDNLFALFLETEKNIGELKQIYANIPHGKDNTAQLTKIANLKKTVKIDLDLIQKKFDECMKLKIIGPQEDVSISGGYTKREDFRPEPLENIEYVEPIEASNNSQLDTTNDYKK